MRSSRILGTPHPNRTLAVLLLAGLAYAVSQTAVIPALPHIQRDLGTTESGVTWTMSGFFVAAAITTGIFGRLGDMHGKKTVLMVVLSIFAAGSLLSALSSSIGMLVAGRVIMGAGGAVFPLAFAIARDEMPRERIPTAMGLLSAVIGVGAGLGLLAGGAISDHSDYSLIFWLVCGLAAIALTSTALFVPASPLRAPAPLDLTGAALLSVGLAGPLVAISEAGTWGWGSARTLGVTALGVAVLGLFARYERGHHAPLVHMPTFVRRQILTTNATTLLAGFGLFGSSLLSAQFVQGSGHGYGFGATATQAGLFLLPASLVMLLASMYAGRLGERIGARGVLVVGAIAATAGLVLLGVAHDERLEVYIWNSLVYLGVGLVSSATPVLIIGGVDAERTAESTATNTIVRYIGSSLGAQVAASIITTSALKHGGAPTDDAFTVAFLVGAAGTAAALVTAFVIPNYRHAAATAAA